MKWKCHEARQPVFDATPSQWKRTPVSPPGMPLTESWNVRETAHHGASFTLGAWTKTRVNSYRSPLPLQQNDTEEMTLFRACCSRVLHWAVLTVLVFQRPQLPMFLPYVYSNITQLFEFPLLKPAASLDQDSVPDPRPGPWHREDGQQQWPVKVLGASPSQQRFFIYREKQVWGRRCHADEAEQSGPWCVYAHGGEMQFHVDESQGLRNEKKLEEKENKYALTGWIYLFFKLFLGKVDNRELTLKGAL